MSQPSENLTQMDGLNFILEMRDQGKNYPPIGKLVGFIIHEVSRGKIRVSGQPTEQHYNPLGVVHGGFASTLMDLALGHVSITTLPSMKEGVSTIDLSVKYLRPIFASTGKLYCESSVVYKGKKVVIADARLLDASGKLYATAESTCLVIARRTKT